MRLSRTLAAAVLAVCAVLAPAPARASSTLGVHEVTTGWADTGVFHLEFTLGHLHEAPAAGFTRALYGCVQGSDDYFNSLDGSCEGQLVLGLDGYLSPVAAPGLVELYRCYNGDHFISTDPGCEHTRTEGVLGWATP